MARISQPGKTPQISATTQLVFKVPNLFSVKGDNDSQETAVGVGQNWISYEYEAHVNTPETVKVRVLDPHHTIFDEHMAKYFSRSIEYQHAPLMMQTRASWVPGDKNSSAPLETKVKTHAVTAIEPVGGKDGADQSEIVFYGMSLPHYLLAAGDAGGYVYTGSVSDVVKQVCDKYNRGLFRTIFKDDTRDDKHNKWWQNRMHPLAFIKSLLRWTTPLNKTQTRWIWYANTNLEEDSQLIFGNQVDVVKPTHRATYWWGDTLSRKGHGDIIRFAVLGDNTWDTWRGKLVTSGTSVLSGAYHDRIVHEKSRDYVFVDNEHTRTKIVQESTPKQAYRLPSTEEPLKDPIGWTRAISVPEFSAGEIGLRYQDYIDGYAMGQYYRDYPKLEQIALTVTGHHIWSESEGLGSDSIDIVFMTQKRQPHFLQGNWIVEGFKQVVTRKGWETILYCYRTHQNAKGHKVGRKKTT